MVYSLPLQSGELSLCDDSHPVAGVCYAFSVVLVAVGICAQSVGWCSLCPLTVMECGMLTLKGEWSGIACQCGRWSLMAAVGVVIVVGVWVDLGVGPAELVVLGLLIGFCLPVSSTARWRRCKGCAPRGP